MRALFPILIVALAPACSVGRASVALVQADRAITHARARGAADQAPYEFRMAEAYLTKAREEAHSSSYRRSVELSRDAADWADKAVIVMETAGTATDAPETVAAPARPTAPTMQETPAAEPPEPEPEPEPAPQPAPEATPDAPAEDAPDEGAIVIPLPESEPAPAKPKVIILKGDEQGDE